jgi:hypothetical protein
MSPHCLGEFSKVWVRRRLNLAYVRAANPMRTQRRLVHVSLLVCFGGFSLAALVGGALTARPAQASENGNRPGCSDHLQQRTAEDTIRQHLALLQAGQLDQAMCDYSDDAQVILPGHIVQGLDNIKAGLAGVGTLLGGAVPQIQTLTATSSVVMITFTAFGTPCTLPDGSDTYIVDHGHIVVQTVHDTLHDAPGATCPVPTL